MPTFVVGISILPQRKVVSHKKNKSSEIDELVDEVWLDWTGHYRMTPSQNCNVTEWHHHRMVSSQKVNITKCTITER